MDRKENSLACTAKVFTRIRNLNKWMKTAWLTVGLCLCSPSRLFSSELDQSPLHVCLSQGPPSHLVCLFRSNLQSDPFPCYSCPYPDACTSSECLQPTRIRATYEQFRNSYPFEINLFQLNHFTNKPCGII